MQANRFRLAAKIMQMDILISRDGIVGIYLGKEKKGYTNHAL